MPSSLWGDQSWMGITLSFSATLRQVPLLNILRYLYTHHLTSDHYHHKTDALNGISQSLVHPQVHRYNIQQTDNHFYILGNIGHHAWFHFLDNFGVTSNAALFSVHLLEHKCSILHEYSQVYTLGSNECHIFPLCRCSLVSGIDSF